MAELWQRGRVRLVWSPEHELHGLEIVMRRRSLAELNDFTLQERPGDGKDWADLTDKERVAQREANAADIAELIVSWNLADDEGCPVPRTAEGVLAACDGPMISAMWEAYNAVALRMAPPLSPSSNAGPAAQPPGEWDLGPQETLTPAD